MPEKIAVVGLGYVGLPVALAFARRFPGTVGFDINAKRVDALKTGLDYTGETSSEDLQGSPICFTSDPADLCGCTFFVVAVPTPVDRRNQPDLTPLLRASHTVGAALSKGAVVVYESTVYPGVTEDFCGPILAEKSGLKAGVDFKLGYSPERINPGDREHTLERITKVVSGQDAATLDRVAEAYGGIIEAGVFRATSIKAAEAAKVIENTQRDLNIALMNELSIIFNRIGLRTKDVLEAAGTKWNFLRFSPGLVGGHCIGVDPYYLTALAEQVGYHPEVILAGRRVNDNMGRFVAENVVKLMIHADVPVRRARVGILGLTFKENVPDLRNSRVPSIIDELKQYRIEPFVHDPLADPGEALHEYGITLSPFEALNDLDGLIYAVSHREYTGKTVGELIGGLRQGGVLADVKSAIDPASISGRAIYWSL
jgi:UDP-N-acetyl-D-glucosamine/UDP-N-acetyl-D-galactosamine dehydrogenase